MMGRAGLFSVVATAALLTLSSCKIGGSGLRHETGGTPPEPADVQLTSSDTVVGFAALNERYFKRSCAAGACHGGERGIAGLSFDNAERAYRTLIEADPTTEPAHSDGLVRVARGDPKKSFLWHKLTESPITLNAKKYGVPMPFGGSAAPGTATLAAIRQWIEGGAPFYGLDFTPDTVEKEGAYISCKATDAAGMRACFPQKPAGDVVRVYTPPMTIPANQEVQMCSYLQLPLESDLIYRVTEGYQMRGGHHAAIFTSRQFNTDPTPHPCSNAEMEVFEFSSGAGGEGGPGFAGLPEGLALKITAGSQLVVQSHYINYSDQPLRVMDAVDFHRVDPQQVTDIVGPFTVVNQDFTIPAGAKSWPAEMICNIDREMDLHLLLGHTHELGSLYTMELLREDQDPVLLYRATDGPLLRNNPELKIYEEALQVGPGDRLRMVCQWDNDRESGVGWPEEMCVGLFYYTPSTGFLSCNAGDPWPRLQGQEAGEDQVPCQPEGQQGNELGVGTACSVGGRECSGQKAGFCMTPFAPEENYCTIIFCRTDAECGQGAYCQKTDAGSACVVDRCLNPGYIED